MYNLNVNLAQSAANVVNNLLTAESACSTPKTPEILNHLIAMTNPLDSYAFGSEDQKSQRRTSSSKSSNGMIMSVLNDSDSSTSCSQVGSPLGGGGGAGTPPSIQHTCSQLIKAGLKLSIEQKRKHNSESDDYMHDDYRKRCRISESESEERKHEGGLTAEDEERRRRRRERNKIAATKCRLKKRERTNHLIREAESLDVQNVEYKKQLQDLRNEHYRLKQLLDVHRPHCDKNVPRATRDDVFARLPANVIECNHSYNRIQSFKPSDLYSPDGAYVPFDTKSPSIVLDSPDDLYQLQFENLDGSPTYYNNNHAHTYPSANQGYSDSGCMA